MTDLFEGLWQRLKSGAQQCAARGVPLTADEADEFANEIIDASVPNLNEEARDFYVGEFCAMLDAAFEERAAEPYAAAADGG